MENENIKYRGRDGECECGRRLRRLRGRDRGEVGDPERREVGILASVGDREACVPCPSLSPRCNEHL
eukprot:6183333-Pleurochrysis_carterae.AAC.1